MWYGSGFGSRLDYERTTGTVSESYEELCLAVDSDVRSCQPCSPSLIKGGD